MMILAASFQFFLIFGFADRLTKSLIIFFVVIIAIYLTCVGAAFLLH